MERRVRVLIRMIIFFSFVPLLPAAASPDYGGTVTLSAELADDGKTLSFPFSTSANFYYNTELFSSAKLSFSLQTGWKETSLFDGIPEEVGGPLPVYIVYPDKLSVEFGVLKSQLKIGRMIFADKTGRIFNQTSDGLAVDFPLFNSYISLYGCYTGFQWKNESDVIMSSLDQYFSALQDTVFAAPRLIISASVTASFIKNHNLYLGVLSQKDCRDPADNSLLILKNAPRETDAIGGTVDTWYYYAGAEGSIFSLLAYSLFGITETGSEMMCPREGEYKDIYINGDILAFCAGGSLRTFLPILFGSFLKLEAVYSSGDIDKNSVYEGNLAEADNYYLPVSVMSTGNVLPFQLGNTWYVDLSYIFFPFKKARRYELLDTMVISQARAHFRSSVGPISVYGMDTASLSPYLGTEVSFSGGLKLLSDLALAFGFSMFFPGMNPDGAFEADIYSARPVLFAGSLSLQLGF